MSIHTDLGTRHAECDSCGYDEELEAKNFQEVIEEIKEAGWLVTKVDGEWQHICPACKEEIGS